MFFWGHQFPPEKNKQIRLYYYDTSGRLVFVRFLEEINDTKKPFQNYLTFTNKKDMEKLISSIKEDNSSSSVRKNGHQSTQNFI